MITLIIHDTKSAATKDVAKKHKSRFFNMTQFLSGGGVNRKNKLNKLKKANAKKEGEKIANIDDNEEGNSKIKDKIKKNKGKNKEKSKEKNTSNTNKRKGEEQGRYIIPLRDESSDDKGKETKKKPNLTVTENKKETSTTSSITPLINSNSNPSSSNHSNKSPNSNPSRPNSNQGDEEPPKEVENSPSPLVTDPPKLYESPKLSEEEPNIIYESPKEYNKEELKKSIIDQKSDLFTSGNLTSSMTIKKFYKANPSSVGKPLTSIFENPETDQDTNENDIHPPTTSSTTTSNLNALDTAKAKAPKTTFKSLPVPNSAGSGSNSETENESTIFDYNAYRKNASNKNYVVGMLKQHYQNCLDEIDYVRKREKTLNSLKSGFEKGIMALQTM